jgi:hypothetical protein
LSPFLKMGRRIAVYQSAGIQLDLNDCCIKSEAGVDKGSAQFFRTLAVMKSGPEDLEVFSFLNFSRTVSLEKIMSVIQLGLQLPERLGAARGGSVINTLEKVSANTSATPLLLSTTKPELP